MCFCEGVGDFVDMLNEFVDMLDEFLVCGGLVLGWGIDLADIVRACV